MKESDNPQQGFITGVPQAPEIICTMLGVAHYSGAEVRSHHHVLSKKGAEPQTYRSLTGPKKYPGFSCCEGGHSPRAAFPTLGTRRHQLQHVWAQPHQAGRAQPCKQPLACALQERTQDWLVRASKPTPRGTEGVSWSPQKPPQKSFQANTWKLFSQKHPHPTPNGLAAGNPGKEGAGAKRAALLPSAEHQWGRRGGGSQGGLGRK